MTTRDAKLISEAMRLLGSRTSAAKAVSSRANGWKGGRPRKDGGAPRPAAQGVEPAPAGLAPLWQRLETFLRAHGPTTLRSLRCVAVDRAERERVRQELQRRPALFGVTPSPTFGGELWQLL